MGRVIEIILTDDIDTLGYFGDKRRVRMGFARNYLIPRGLALPANDAGALKQFEDIRKREEKKRAKLKAEFESVLQKLNGQKIELSHRVHDDGALYGSVNAKDIISAIQDAFKVELKEKQIVLKEPIKKIGDYAIALRLFPKVEGSIQLSVVAKEASAKQAK